MCLNLTMFKHVREKNVGQNLILDILMISWRLDYPWGLPARSKNPRILIKYYQLLTTWANFGLLLNFINLNNSCRILNILFDLGLNLVPDR